MRRDEAARQERANLPWAAYRACQPARLAAGLLLLLGWLGAAAGASQGLPGYPLASERCPAALRMPPVRIKALEVDWAGRSASLQDALFFEMDALETGQMRVLFWDLDPRYAFDRYLVMATPDSELARDEELAVAYSSAARTPDGEGVITHYLNLEPGYEYGVKVYAVSRDFVTLLSAEPDTEYATTLLSPLYFGGYQLHVDYACTGELAVLQREGCYIDPETALVATHTSLAFDPARRNSHVLELHSDSETTRTVRFLDPLAFGPGDYKTSDLASRITHYQLRVWAADGDQALAYRRRMALDDASFWVVSSNTYRLWHPDLARDPNPPQPRDPQGQGFIANPERFRTAWQASFTLRDGAYVFEIAALEKRKDDDTDEITYKVLSAPSRLTADIGSARTRHLNQFSDGQYRKIWDDFETGLSPDSEDLHWNYWAEVMFPDWDEREPLLYGMDDLALRLNATLK